MEKKEFDEKAQMMTLEALIASLLIIAAVLFVVSQVPPQAQHGGSFSNVQLNHYGDDLLNVLKKSSSTDAEAANYDNLIQYYIGENNYSELNILMENSLPDNVGYSVSLVSGDDKELLFSNGYPVGEQVVVSEIVVSKNVGLGGIAGAPAGIRKVTKTFPVDSLIIPMDDDNDEDGTDQKNILKAMGLVYHIANGTYSDGKAIPVWQIFQDPRNDTYMYFDWKIDSNDKPSNVSNGIDNKREYAGGPYIIDSTDLTSEIRQNILNASKMNFTTDDDDVIVHQVIIEFTYWPAVEMVKAPKIGVYPPEGNYSSELNDTIEKYYEHSGIPYIQLNDEMIIDGKLDDIDIITVPHANLSLIPDDVATKIINWVSDGGTIHAECLSLTTLDAKVEVIDGNNHPWYGFIGIKNILENEGSDYAFGRSMIFVGNSSLPGEDNTNNYGDYADPGACFDVLAQSGDINGQLPGSSNASVPAFKLIHDSDGIINHSMINPDLVILSGAGINKNEDSNSDSNSIMYVSAPFDKGFVTYLAGYDMSVDDEGNPTPHKERLMFHTVFYPGFGKIYDYGVVELQITMWYK